MSLLRPPKSAAILSKRVEFLVLICLYWQLRKEHFLFIRAWILSTAVTHLDFDQFSPNAETCGLKLMEISRVSGSLQIKGRPRLYWDLSPTLSVQLSYRLLEYLERQTQRTQSTITLQLKLLSQKNNLCLSRRGLTLFHIPIKRAGAFISQGHRRENIMEINTSNKTSS